MSGNAVARANLSPIFAAQNSLQMSYIYDIWRLDTHPVNPRFPRRNASTRTKFLV